MGGSGDCVLYMNLYSLTFMDHPCTLGAAVCRQVNVIQMGTHSNEEVDKKYTGFNMKTTELLDCAYRGVCGN